MAEAGREEKRLAEERENFHEGVPAITVIVDGGWSKHSHKHSYNANSGVAIIVGKATRKLLYIEYETSIAQLAHRVFQRRITPVTEIGMHSHHR